MKTQRDLAHDIVELFEDLLIKKDIVVPCESEIDKNEQYDENGEPNGYLYGSEYWDLVNAVQLLLEEHTLMI